MPGPSNGDSSRNAIRAILENHPEFVGRILARSAGSMGELMVADRLSGLGYQVEPNSPGAQQSDIVAQTSSGEKFEVEVKTVSKRSYYWFSKRPVMGRADYWILVCLNREDNMLPEMDRVEFFVLTTEEAQRVWDAIPYNRKPAPSSGAKAPDLRRSWIEKVLGNTTRNAFHKLPSPD